ncbi:MAG: ABC transporter permease [Verrucomicrobia bacterium]|jgi:oligopeptide transport system permease protein|nr:ABC transporter permease [Verrucomicrobiota bacterium]
MRYVLRRLAFMVPILIGISFAAFALIRLAPGGPFDRERQVPPEIERQLNARYHLDQPLWRQYWIYLGGLVRGDLGPSMRYRNHAVNDIIAAGLPVSLTIGGLAFCFALGTGVPLGFYAAIRKGQLTDQLGSLVAITAICVPTFVAGPILVMVFGVKLRWFPVALWDSAWHTVLPVLTLGIYFAGRVARLMREGMLNTLHAGFIVTARAKGLSENAVFWRHGFRLGVLPVLSYSGPLLADLLTGSFVVENLFQIPGIGVFMVNSSLNRDYPMVVGLVLLYAVLLLVLNLAVDLLYAVLDPRVRHE